MTVVTKWVIVKNNQNIAFSNFVIKFFGSVLFLILSKVLYILPVFILILSISYFILRVTVFHSYICFSILEYAFEYCSGKTPINCYQMLKKHLSGGISKCRSFQYMNFLTSLSRSFCCSCF